MKNVRFIFPALLCVSLGFVCDFSQAQQPARQPVAAQTVAAQPARQPAAAATQQYCPYVAVVDLGAIIDQHPAVGQEMPLLVQEMQKIQSDLAQTSQDLEGQLNGLQQQYKIGSAEYEEASAPIRQKMRDAQALAMEQQQKLITRRTQLLYRVYKDVQAAIQAVATQNKIFIVHSKIKLGSAPNVSEEVIAIQEADQNTVVWNHPACDITEAVKTQLASAVGPAQVAAATGTGSPLANLGSQAMSAANGTAPAATPRPTTTANAGAAPRR